MTGWSAAVLESLLGPGPAGRITPAGVAHGQVAGVAVTVTVPDEVTGQLSVRAMQAIDSCDCALVTVVAGPVPWDRSPRRDRPVIAIAGGPLSVPAAVQLAAADLSLAGCPAPGLTLDRCGIDPDAAAGAITDFLGLLLGPAVGSWSADDDPTLDVPGVVVDSGRLFQFGFADGSALRTGLGRIAGRPVGLTWPGDGSCLSPSDIGALLRLHGFCRRFGLPLVTLADTAGVGLGPAPTPIQARQLCRLIEQVQDRTGPTVAVVTGRACGLGATALGVTGAPRAMVVAWPGAVIAARSDRPPRPLGSAVDGEDPLDALDALDALDGARDAWLLDVIEPDHTAGFLREVIDLFDPAVGEEDEAGRWPT